MKIAIDARTYFLRSGVGRYTKGLVDSMLANFPEDNFTILISNRKSKNDFPDNFPNAKIVISEADLNDYDSEQKYLPAEMTRPGVDLAFFPFFVLPEAMNIPAVSTVLDITFLRDPKYHLKENIDYLNKYLDRTIESADRINTISNYVKDDLLSYAKSRGADLDADRVCAIYPGVNDSFFEEPDASQVARTLAKYRLAESEFFLYVGSIEPRKNVPQLLKAYDRIKTDKPLVLAGAVRWSSSEYESALKSLRHPERVRPLGFVPDEELVLLYKAAAGLLYPSLSEGFGFPVAEGYASNTAVFTSDNSSMKEIGEGAFLTDPENSEKMCADLRRFVMDETLRVDLTQKGKKISGRYRWNRFAHELHDLLSSVV